MPNQKIESLAKDNFIHLQFHDYMPETTDWMLYSKDAVVFFQSYGNLPKDEFMRDGGQYRQRRFGSFEYDTEKNQLHYLGNSGFFQSKVNNELNGGITRHFASLEDHVIDNSFLYLLIKKNSSYLPDYKKHSKWSVFVHQIRVTSTPGQIGNPAPEGIHRDGHAYVAQILIAKNSVNGAVSQLYNDKKLSIFSHELQSPLETILIDDRKLYHDVSSLEVKKNRLSGYRDMLLIDFNTLD